MESSAGWEILILQQAIGQNLKGQSQRLILLPPQYFKPTYIHTQEFWDHHMLLICSVRRGCESLSQWESALSVITDPQAMGSVHMWALPVWLLSFYLKLTVQQTALIPAKGTHNTQERERVGNTFSSVSCLQMCLGMNGSNFRMLLTYPRGAQKHPSRLCVQYMH